MTLARTLTLTRYALAFYVGATFALLLPFASPLAPAISAPAWALAFVLGVRP